MSYIRLRRLPGWRAKQGHLGRSVHPSPVLFLPLSHAAISRKPSQNLMTFSLCRVSCSRHIAQGHWAVTCLTCTEHYFEDHDGSWQQGAKECAGQAPMGTRTLTPPISKDDVTYAGLLLCFSAQRSCPAQLTPAFSHHLKWPRAYPSPPENMHQLCTKYSTLRAPNYCLVRVHISLRWQSGMFSSP